MATALSLKAEAQRRADASDAELARRLAARLRKCSRCKYPENKGLFAEWLECYVALKRLYQIGMRDKAGDPEEMAKFHVFLTAYESKTGDIIGEEESMTNIFWRAKRYRSSLESIWPCEACMAEFQPTKKSERNIKKLLNLSLT